MKKKTTIPLILVLIAGLSLLLYPAISNYWNRYHASRAVASYVEKLNELDGSKLESMWNDAVEYNESLPGRAVHFELTEEESALYNSLLDMNGTGIMGYIEIPCIDVLLPVYHGVDDSVLAVATGHIEWTSLPVGGKSSHCVISGHRGLPSAKLFTNLDRVAEGDIFTLSVLDRVLTYEVDRILIVEPGDTESLMIEDGKDYCTLVTCTPYGINSHRMLVRGHRVENIEETHEIRIISDAMKIEPMIVAPIIAAPVLLILLFILIFSKGEGNNRKRGKSDET